MSDKVIIDKGSNVSIGQCQAAANMAEAAAQQAAESVQTILSAIGNKVDKEAGKGLSSNDYDNTAKNKVDKLSITQVVDLDAVKNASHTHANASVLGKIGVSAGGKMTYNNEIIFKNDANQINNTPAGNITASNVQAALNELDSKKAPASITNSPTLTGTVTLGGGQLKFPATQSASSDPNTLDDYEEGTFTPVVVGSDTAGIGTYTFSSGVYTKVGNLVTFSLRLSWTAHTGTGSMLISGLPFAPAYDSSCAITVGTLTFTGFLGCKVQTDMSTRIFQIDSGTISDVLIATSVNNLTISGSYKV